VSFISLILQDPISRNKKSHNKNLFFEKFWLKNLAE